MNDLKKDPTVTAKLNSLGSDSSVDSFENAQGKTTSYRPCTIVYTIFEQIYFTISAF